MTTKNEIVAYTAKLLDTALKECEEMEDYTDSNMLINMAEVDVDNVISAVVDEMDLNIVDPAVFANITGLIKDTSIKWANAHIKRLEKLND